ncbi:MAG: MBL fold metallo-hydrolase [Planctomycetia bacterium]
MRFTVGIALCLLLGLGGFVYFFIVDGRVPQSTDFNPSIADIRRLANAPAEERPSAIEVEFLAEDRLPFFGLQAGLDIRGATMARSAFRLKSNWGDTIIDVGMDRYVAALFKTGEKFDDTSLARIGGAMVTARRIVVTHEHPDHLGYLPRSKSLDQLIPKLRLTREQIDATGQYMEDGKVPEAFRGVDPVPSKGFTSVAPGVVLIPAPGHTPGSVLFFVQMADGRKVLFIGDIVWTMSNIRDQTGRSRLVQSFLMQTPESRPKT